jgi:UDP-2,3-diacylglucosamine pyrophosphatase LpxH
MRISRYSLFLLLSAALAAVHAQTPPFRITTGPYLQNPSATTMTVVWITNRNATGAVEYGPPDGELKTAFSSHDGLIDSNDRIHKVVLTELCPGTTYRYRVVSRDILNFGPYKVDFGATADSGLGEIRTFDPRKQSFSFLVFNDMHDLPATIPDMLKAAGDRPCDFVLWNGDSISDIENEDQITAMLDEAVKGFASRIPLFWTRGNHEARGKFARQFPLYLASPNGRFFYSFDHGPVHFVVLDTGEDKVDTNPAYSGLVDFQRYRREEGEWLKAEVETEAFRKAKYRVVFAHMPFPAAPRNPAPNNQPGPANGMEDAYQNFGATLNAAGIDMMISGHIHAAAIIGPEPGRHSYPIVRGGGPEDQTRTVIRVDVTDRALEAVVLRPDGTAFGTCRVPAKR